MGRYTHDLSRRPKPGGLFFNTAIPNVATTLTDVPGQIFVGQLTTTIRSNMLNELSLQFSSNAIKSVYGDNVRNTARRLRPHHPGAVPGEPQRPDPASIQSPGISQPSARNQLFDNEYRNFTHHRQPVLAARQPLVQGRVPVRVRAEGRDLRRARPRARFNFARRRRLHRLPELPARQPRRRLRRELRLHGAGASRSTRTFRCNRYEFYVQDSWRAAAERDARLRPALRAVSRRSRTRTTC